MFSRKTPVSPTQKVLNVWAVVIIVWSVYRVYFKTELPIFFDEFIAKPAVFLIPVYYYITKVEKKNFFSAIDLKSENLLKNILLGMAIGFIFFISGTIGIFLKSQNISTVFTNQNFAMIGSFLLIALATSISEEVLSRGFVLKRLYAESKNAFSSSFFASILFFFLHVPILFTNDKIVGTLLLKVMFTDLILSLAVSFIYLERRNLLLPILIHAFYNLSLYLFI